MVWGFQLGRSIKAENETRLHTNCKKPWRCFKLRLVPRFRLNCSGDKTHHRSLPQLVIIKKDVDDLDII
jgi:hypothetical protein